jgi:hypothetical protein
VEITPSGAKDTRALCPKAAIITKSPRHRMCPQVVEGFARKMLGGLSGRFGKQLLGKSGGKLAKMGVDQVASSAFSFASTWAIGQLAKRYYANNRSWSGLNARESYESLRLQAESLHQKVLPQIQQEASGLSYGKVLSMVRGQNTSGLG